MRVENTPSDAPSVTHEAACCRPSFFRYRNRGGFRLDDAHRFFEDGCEVGSFVCAEGSGDIFPHHVSWSNKLTCPSGSSVIFSHLLDNSDLFHKQAGAFSSQTGAFPSDAEVLARRTAYDTVNRLDFGAVYFANISDVLHLNRLLSACQHLLGGVVRRFGAVTE